MCEQKCVMIIDETLPVGLIANAAAVMGITIGKRHPEAVGHDVKDQTGVEHLGVIAIPVPILKGSAEILRGIREALHTDEYSALTVVDFFDTAQGCNTYDEYVAKMADTREENIRYFGVAIYGDKKRINRLTGSMPLMR